MLILCGELEIMLKQSESRHQLYGNEKGFLRNVTLKGLYFYDIRKFSLSCIIKSALCNDARGCKGRKEMDEKLIVVARIHTDFREKFGIPRQSGLVPSLRGEIHFEGEFCNPDAIRGIEEYSHLWLLWGFSKAKRDAVNLTVAPPRLGGRERKGVFATRSPFRPNSIGLSSVRLEEVKYGNNGEPVLVVSGADLLDDTPIYDIKPYLPYTDSHPEAGGGFGEAHSEDRIAVIFPENLKQQIPEELRQTVLELLSQDPRAAYNKKPDFIYGMNFAGYDIRFVVEDGVLIVKEIADTRSFGWKKIK